MAYEIKSKPYWGLNILVVILVGVLLAVLLIPKQIWNEEQRYREQSHTRMQNLWKVENVFLRLTGDYTELGEHTIKTVNLVYDTLKSGADYTGTHQITFPPKQVTMNIDTTTIHTITMLFDSTLADTSWDAYRQNIIDTYNTIALNDSTQTGQFAVRALQAAYDSIQAQDNWQGEKQIILPFQYEVDVPEGYVNLYDTTFVRTERRRTVVQDTSFWAEMQTDPETGERDTTWVPKRDLSDMEYRYPDLRILDTSLTQQDRWLTEQIAIRPDTSWLYDPLTGKGFIFKRSADGLHLRIESPIKGEYSEPRYYVFSLSDTSHGFIEDGEPSWQEEEQQGS
ncbi:MAG TPA: hypothetical protein VKA68_17915 [bacterium]|nr:hypothetical protein [bacterium]